MALRTQYKGEDGIQTGYYRIVQLHTHYEKNKGEEVSFHVKFDVQCYLDGTDNQILDGDYLENKCGTHAFNISQSDSVGDLVALAYAYLKTIDKFSQAEDC